MMYLYASGQTSLYSRDKFNLFFLSTWISPYVTAFSRQRLPPLLLSRLRFTIQNANLEFVKLAEKNSKRRPPWANRLSEQRLHDWIKSLVPNAEQLEFEHTW